RAGNYALPGNISSQFVTGMLLALPLVEGVSTLKVEGRLESADYVRLTLDALKRAGIEIKRECSLYRVPGGQKYGISGNITVEGDWSGAAFLLCAGAASEAGVTVCGLDPASAQGDRRVTEILRAFGAVVETAADRVTARKSDLHGITLDASDIPDLVPAIAALAAQVKGETVIKGAARLRLKESDRLETTAAMLRALGGTVAVNDDGLTITGGRLTGGNTDSYGDHRIAMAAAVASMGCSSPVTVGGAECVTKSYPHFWEDYQRATGH
ncbi:MAG: 3-phosphoshikimate 1-carboxyvinyltransferase, partial [Clostridia bacterium]|nr:3-phosphoshikimate 1-carboxyvinyltransferase [Clostridia bacterium]